MQLAIVSGGKVVSQSFFTPTERGLLFSDAKMPVEQWRFLMNHLSQSKTKLALYSADAINYGRKHYGDSEVETTLEQVSFNLVDAQRAIGIGSLSEATRGAAPSLSAEHLWVLAKAELESKEEVRWATTAVEKGLSASDLQASIEAGKVVKSEGRGSGATVTVHGIRQMFEVLKKRWEDDGPVEKWPEDRKRRLWKELDAQTRFGVRLASSLGIKVDA